MKYMVNNGLLLMVVVTFVIGCKSKNKIEPEEKTSNELIYPIMPIQQQSYLFDNVEMIDYIFQDLPFSLSQSEKPSIQAKIAGIAQEGVTQSDCTPMARMFFQYKGEIIIEADVFFAPPDCQHYIFYEDGKPVYANKMAPQNIQFYSQFLKNMNVSQ